MIISASRRTDIPAFYGDWFMNRIEAGECLVVHPFNPTAVSRVPLTRDEVEAIVFWSKNPAPFMDALREIDRKGYPTCVLFTLNDYPEVLEPAVPPVGARVDTFRGVARLIGPDRTVWRYDPIILSRRFNADYHLSAFARLAEALKGSTSRVIVSFVDFYRKTERRLQRVEQVMDDVFCRDAFSDPGFEKLVRGLAATAERAGIEIQTCAEDPRIADLGIRPGKCIDDGLIRRCFGITVSPRKDPGQRSPCRCVVSKDVGATDSCLHGCEYCYSTVSCAAARTRAARHDPHSPFLIPPRE